MRFSKLSQFSSYRASMRPLIICFTLLSTFFLAGVTVAGDDADGSL